MKKTSVLFLGFGALVLVALFLLLKPASSPVAVTVTEVPAAVSSVVTQPLPEKNHVFEMVVEHGAKRSGPDVMQVTEDDQVTLKISSDHADELHVHGYDLHATVKAGVPAILSFKADRTGRFTMELHHSNAELGVLEVRPR